MLKTNFNTLVKIQLYKQKLLKKSELTGINGINTLLNDLGYIQLDTMNVTARSQDIFLWTRILDYKKSMLLDLYKLDLIFEQYLYALCILPSSSISYLIDTHSNNKAKLQEDPELDFILDIYNKAKSKKKLQSINSNNKTSSNDAWQVTPTRNALDKLWRADLLRVKRDSNFRKVYSLPPERSNTVENKSETMLEYFIDKAFENLGIATIKEAKNYFGLNKKETSKIINGMISDKKLLPIMINGINDGESHYIRECDVHLLEKIAQVESEACTLLTPFDNLLRDRSRVQKLFNVDYRLESYIPKDKRKFGYFGMPILIGERLVGVIDLKLFRNEKKLQVNKLTLFYPMEKEFHLKEIGEILKRFAKFIGAESIEYPENKECAYLEV
ncbi:DNA glycosylase AlkZ-like family protein [Bacillus pumilus]|uniref:DNA glycosylase AlkZ-like family protein n=1 Tax=Bacillus TaxID=1386 RepID=UPI0007614D71|nr:MULTISPECIES: crosslink repair DNA glycosylase YcaQ family protein [Bacillus]MBR0619227.1 winged helix-turn-helix domain-containing protein [Bacillus pumilus]MCW6697775.1 winged helix DNA-binding domain-containing protein [Bacillus sp. RP12]